MEKITAERGHQTLPRLHAQKKGGEITKRSTKSHVLTAKNPRVFGIERGEKWRVEPRFSVKVHSWKSVATKTASKAHGM